MNKIEIVPPSAMISTSRPQTETVSHGVGETPETKPVVKPGPLSFKKRKLSKYTGPGPLSFKKKKLQKLLDQGRKYGICYLWQLLEPVLFVFFSWGLRKSQSFKLVHCSVRPPVWSYASSPQLSESSLAGEL